MTQNNEHDAKVKLARLRFFRDLSDEESLKIFHIFGVLPDDCDGLMNLNIQSTLFDKWQARVQSPISQNEQQEAVDVKAFMQNYGTQRATVQCWKPYDDNFYTKYTVKAMLEDITKLYTSPPKQAIPEGWKPIETAPKGESVLVAGGDCSYPCVANWSGHHEDVWCVDGQMDSYAEIGWPAYWMALDSLPALPTALTNTEVGE